MDHLFEFTPPPTIIVSGHPRTGTSTMMRMLKLGGVEILATEKTTREGTYKYNPHGVYELGEVMDKLQQYAAPFTSGKAVKVVAPYLHVVPLDRPLKVIFMTRDLREVIASLLTMRTVWKYSPDEILEAAQRFIKENDLEVLYVDYHEMVEYPRTTAVRVADFLGMELNVGEMTKAVDKNVRELSKKTGPADPRTLITFDVDKDRVRVNG